MGERFFIVWEEKDDFLEITETVYEDAKNEEIPLGEAAHFIMNSLHADRYQNFSHGTSRKVIADWIKQGRWWENGFDV